MSGVMLNLASSLQRTEGDRERESQKDRQTDRRTETERREKECNEKNIQ